MNNQIMYLKKCKKLCEEMQNLSRGIDTIKMN